MNWYAMTAESIIEKLSTDVKTGTKYVTGKDGKTKVVRRPKEKEQDR